MEFVLWRGGEKSRGNIPTRKKQLTILELQQRVFRSIVHEFVLRAGTIFWGSDHQFCVWIFYFSINLLPLWEQSFSEFFSTATWILSLSKRFWQIFLAKLIPKQFTLHFIVVVNRLFSAELLACKFIHFYTRRGKIVTEKGKKILLTIFRVANFPTSYYVTKSCIFIILTSLTGKSFKSLWHFHHLSQTCGSWNFIAVSFSLRDFIHDHKRKYQTKLYVSSLSTFLHKW